MSLGLQEWIHRMEEGGGARYVKILTFVTALLVMGYTYNARYFKNFSSPEAMDTAQLARNLAEGKGYTTRFLRPVSLWMVAKKSGDMKLDAHPDLANPPLYPYLLAGVMKAWPPEPVTTDTAKFRTYEPEQRIACLNEGLFFVALFIVFRLARRLFDEPTAWVSVLLLAGADLWWRFSISGTSTLLLVVLVLLLTWCLVAMEAGAREKQWGVGGLLVMALLAGALAGACGLTRYSFLGLILPAFAFVLLGVERLKPLLGVALLVGFASVVSPWLMRNHELSGTFFGTAGLTVYEDTVRFPANRLERSLNPANPDVPTDLAKVDLAEHWGKMWSNLPGVLQNDLPRLGGSWIGAFFLTGLLIRFRNPGLSRLRWFVCGAMAVLAVLQALGRTQLSTVAPDVNTENLLVLFAPLVAIYGAGLYFTLLEQIGTSHPGVRGFVNSLFVFVGCTPLFFRLTGDPVFPIAYPPYYPPAIQECSAWLEDRELMASDVPWAVAWYGRRTCVWLPMDIQDEFRAINAKKPIVGLYLTQLTTDGRLLSEISQGRDKDWGQVALKTLLRDDPKIKDTVWGNFAWEAVMKEEVPDGFALGSSPGRMTLVGSLFPEQLFLTDRPRWKTP